MDSLGRSECSSSDCEFVHWEHPIPVVAGLVQWRGQYILARNAAWPSDIFSLVTGFLERGEFPQAAVAREVQEELGLDVEHVVFIGHFPLPELNQLIVAYAISARGTVALDEEIAEIKLLKPDELPNFDFGPLTLTRNIVSSWLSEAR